MKAVPPFLFPFLVVCIILVGNLRSQAQEERCGTVPYNEGRSVARFEQWIHHKMSQKQARVQALADDETIYRIPVVVHIVHRGEAVGEGANVSLEQIQDQIRILNEDFRRQNPDTVNTPDVFLPVAADTRIEFVLALQDPEGFATNGVVRVESDRNSYGLSDAGLLSTLSQWDPERYMNLWVAPLSSDLLGYAQLPVSDEPGLEGSSDNAFTDGVVVDYLSFGSIGNLRDRYNGGRTTTHEVGHYLGLRHIWGDGGCGVDDFIEDTPRQADSYRGCPVVSESCGSLDMYDNYMDLTDDACMNIFTEGQKQRMRLVLENSPRRESLLRSPALVVPVPIANDANITRIITPQPSECDPELTPRLRVRNIGINPIETLTAEFSLPGGLAEEVTFDLDLAPGESQEIAFSSVGPEEGLTTGALYEATFVINRVNNTADDNARGNRQSTVFFIPEEDELPLVEDFRIDGTDSFFAKSVVINPDGQRTWVRQVTDTTDLPLNQALFIDFYNYANLEGERDFLYSPTLDLRGLPTATLSFRVAHAPYLNEDSLVSQDGLLVGISTDCGATVERIIYEKFGEVLATQPAQVGPFIPNSPDDWRTETISLDDYLGEPNVQLVFIGVNDHGNNLYLDDIEFFVTEPDPVRPAENSFSIEPNPVVNNQLQLEFNLLSVDDVTVAIYSVRGQVIGEYVFPNTLNQTYTIAVGNRPTGVYIVRAIGQTIEDSKRFILP